MFSGCSIFTDVNVFVFTDVDDSSPGIVDYVAGLHSQVFSICGVGTCVSVALANINCTIMLTGVQ